MPQISVTGILFLHASHCIYAKLLVITISILFSDFNAVWISAFVRVAIQHIHDISTRQIQRASIVRSTLSPYFHAKQMHTINGRNIRIRFECNYG